MNQFPAKNLFLLFLTAFIWGTAFVAQSVGMDHIGPFTFNAVRSLVGGIALLPVILIFQRRKTPERRQQEKANRKTLLLGGLSCGLALGLASGLQQVGIQYTTVGKAGFITALYIVIVPILGLFFRKKVGAKLWISVVIAIFGLYLLCMSGSLRLEWGDFLVLLCAVCFSVHIMVIDYFTTKVDGVQMSCIQFFVAALFSAVCMLFTEGVPDPHAVAISWVPILYAGVLSLSLIHIFQLPIVLWYRTTALLAPKSSRVQQNAELLRLMVYEPLLRPVDLQRITVPTLVIAGTRDMVKTAHTVQLYRKLPDA